jgi:hypothetical protein
MTGDVGTFTALKNTFLSPLAKGRSSGVQTELPSANASSVVTLHDNHNIEIKTVSELCAASSVVETDFFLFVPKNFELSGLGKDELIKDFRSRVRLALPVTGELGAMALDTAIFNLRTKLIELENAERSGEPVQDLNHVLCEQVLEAAKDLSAVLAEALKHRSYDHTRQFLISHTLLTIPQAAITGLTELFSNVSTTAELMDRTRAPMNSDLQAPGAILAFLDEYTSQLYIQYLGQVRAELGKYAAPKNAENRLDYAKARQDLEDLLDSLQEKEARHRTKFGGRAPEEETDLEREHRLVRLSHLKKFFQSKMFVDITRQQSAKKISESTATIGTAMAGVLAATIERFGRPAAVDVAWQGFFFLSFGVIIYVLRDRMKDWAKQLFQKKALQFLPDFEQHLIAKDKRIGKVKEWFALQKSSELPLDVLALRRAASTTEMEKRLPEDVFHCRKIQEVDAASLHVSDKFGQTRALYENTRVNFERYLKHMDDAFKDLTDLDPSGRFQMSRSHRVYHFYLCVKTTSGPKEPGINGKLRTVPLPRSARLEKNLIYRIVLDKNGVVRIENAGSK